MPLKYKRVGTSRALTGLPGGSFGLERSDSTTLFSLGSFRVTSNLRPTVLPESGYELAPVGLIAQHLTLADLQVENLQEARTAIRYQRQLRIPVDPAELGGYGYFGSVRLRLRAAINAVTAGFPAGLVFEPSKSDGRSVATVIAHTHNPLTKQTALTLALDTLFNPFGLNLHVLGQELRPGQPDLLTQTERYVLELDGVEYPLVSVTGMTNSTSGVLPLVVQGNPLGGYALPSLTLRLVVRPAARYGRAQLRASVPELGIYLLGGSAAPLPATEPVVFRLPVEGENFETSDPLIDEVAVSWPRPDGYNIAVGGTSFDSFADQLESYGDALDGYKSDLLVGRYAPPDSLIALDNTEGGKMSALLRVWGRQLDDTKLFIDALVRVNHLDYAPPRGLPEQLVRNLASTLGWRVQPLLDEDQLLQRLYAPGTTQATSSVTNVLPADLDAELWRRIALNTHWFMRAKGTRRAVESVLDLLGIPDGLLRFDEHAYLLSPSRRGSGRTSGRSSGGGVSTTLPGGGVTSSFDDGSGVPVVYQNTGAQGNYLDSFKGRGVLQRIVDNRKVWVAPTEAELLAGYSRTDAGRETKYAVPHGVRVLPSKEVSLSVNPARAWDQAFYQYCGENPGLPGANLVPSGSLRERGLFLVPAESIADFMDKLLANFIDARSFKTSVDYPTLRGLLNAYVREAGASAPTLRGLLEDTKKLNRYWKQLVGQLLPATTLLTQQSLTISNPQLSPSKHRYRQGISVGSEFEQKVVFPPAGDCSVVEISGEVFLPVDGDLYAPELTGSIFVGGEALAYPERSAKAHPRFSGGPLPINFPVAGAISVSKLVTGTPIPLANIFVFGTSGPTKSFTLSAPTLRVTDVRMADLYEMGYALYEARAGAPLVLVQSGWIDSDGYVPNPDDEDVSETSVSVEAAKLLPDREYVVKTYFRKTIHRGRKARTEPEPYDQAGYFRAVRYAALYARNNPNYVDPLSTGYSLTLSNERLLPLPNTFFNSYRATTDFYFPTLALPTAPAFYSDGSVGAVEVYTETITGGGTSGVIDVYLTYRALADPEIYLDGLILSIGDGDYAPVYPLGHPLYYQYYRLSVRTTPDTVVTARYRTGRQTLAVVSENYVLENSLNAYVNLAGGELPSEGVRMFLVGVGGTSTPAVTTGFVLNQVPVAGSIQVFVNGKIRNVSVTETIVINTVPIRIPGVVFMANGSAEPARTAKYSLTYGVLGTTRLDTLQLTSTSWLLDWGWGERYAADLRASGRVAHSFIFELAGVNDFNFTGSLTTLGTFTMPLTGELTSLRRIVDVSALATTNPGQVYLVRIRARKTLNLVNTTTLVREAVSLPYRVRLPGSILSVDATV